MGARYIERITHIEQLLLIDQNTIDTKKLREECSYGVPDQLRPLCWRLFLDYLPRDRQSWKSILAQQRADYNHLIENLIVVPDAGEHEPQPGVADPLDHPLAEESTSDWVHYFKDNEVLIQIDRDVRRLRPEIQFFQMPNPWSRRLAFESLSRRISRERLVAEERYSKISDNSFLSSSETASTSSKPEGPESDTELHWHVVERLLFVYSKVNPGIKYVQGMNELIGPIYYVFASDPDLEWAEHAEADCFYCFQHLMSEIKDNFIKTLDKSNCGIEVVLNNFYDRFQQHDPQLYHHLAISQSIKPQFYAFRWILLLLSQEFRLPDLITLWDMIFSTTDRLDTAQYVCLVMLESMRDELLQGDFSTNLRLLQNFPESDIGQLIVRTNELRQGISSARSHSSSDVSDGSFSNRSNRLFNSAKLSAFVNGAKAKLNTYTLNKRKDNV